jgi:hypothetical protein
MQVIQQANATIKMLSNAVKEAQNQWRECFIMLATVINKFDKEIVLEQDDLIAISPDDYQITIEPVGEQRIIRLRHVTYREEDD